MTNQEAIRLIRNHPTMCEFPDAYGKPYYEAIDMAISALQEKDSLIARLKAEAIKRNVQYMKSGDKYLIGFVDGMRLARSIVDGSIDEPKYVYPSEGTSDDE
jgi:hypothetical protein